MSLYITIIVFPFQKYKILEWEVQFKSCHKRLKFNVTFPWDMMLCNLVERYQHVGRIYTFILFFAIAITSNLTQFNSDVC